jgi:hypothetical protein
VGIPVCEHLAEVIETAVERCDSTVIEELSRTGFEAQSSQTDAVNPLIL